MVNVSVKNTSTNDGPQHRNTAAARGSGGGGNAGAFSGGVSPSPLPRTVLSDTLPSVAAAICLLHGSYLAAHSAYGHGLSAYIGLPRPSAEYCAALGGSNGKCGRPDLFAFQVVSGVTFAIVGCLGIYLWNIQQQQRQPPRGVHQFRTPEARLYGFHAETKWITIVNLAYQIWDFAISWTIPENRTAIMLTHHFIAATVSFSGVYNHMIGYYATFFLGLTEVSSIPLVTLDMSKYFQPQPGTLYEAYISRCAAPLFVLTFVYYRVVMWWRVSKQLLDDVRSVTASGSAQALRPGRTWILYMWVTLSIPMGLLQLYWLTLIAAEAKNAVTA